MVIPLSFDFSHTILPLLVKVFSKERLEKITVKLNVLKQKKKTQLFFLKKIQFEGVH